MTTEAGPRERTPHDLLIIGPGTLGRLIAAEWKQLYPSARITGESRTTTKDAELLALGIQPAAVGATEGPHPYIVFCAPAAGDPVYAEHAKNAVLRASPDTRFLFTSSGSVCGPAQSHVSEETPACPTGRSALLSAAEACTLAHPNGLVVRLSGLYKHDRAAHVSLLTRGHLPFPSSALVNVVHYSDAAHGVVLAMRLSAVEVAALKTRVFVIAGSESISVRQICESSLKHPQFEHLKMPIFTEDAPTPGWKTYSPEWTRRTLNWTPRWESYLQFIHEDAERARRENSVKEAAAV